MLWSQIAWAQEAGAQGGAGGFTALVPFIFMLVVMYFLMIRPQTKRQKQHQEFLSNLKRGDSVLTTSGILGTIEGITDQWVTLEISDGVKVRCLKNSVASSAKEEA